MAGHNRQQCEKLTKFSDSAGRGSWISQVVKGKLCEEQRNAADNGSTGDLLD